MLSWLRALFVPRLLPPTQNTRPDWVDELVEAIQKQSRANVKQGARLEATLAETEAKMIALAAAFERQRAPEREADARAAAAKHAPLFDALDALDEAQRLAIEPHLAAGLLRVADRVQSYCESAGFTRVQSIGAAPVPEWMRIVGTEARAGTPAGHVSRVVRAPILCGERLVREGEVIVNPIEN